MNTGIESRQEISRIFHSVKREPLNKQVTWSIDKSALSKCRIGQLQMECAQVESRTDTSEVLLLGDPSRSKDYRFRVCAICRNRPMSATPLTVRGQFESRTDTSEVLGLGAPGRSKEYRFRVCALCRIIPVSASPLTVRRLRLVTSSRMRRARIPEARARS